MYGCVLFDRCLFYALLFATNFTYASRDGCKIRAFCAGLKGKQHKVVV